MAEIVALLAAGGPVAFDRATLERIRAEIRSGYFGPDRLAALARVDELLAGCELARLEERE